MSREVKYFCNLCTDHKDKKDLLCIYWDSIIKIGESFGGYRLIEDVTKSDKHICKGCFVMISGFIEDNKHLLTVK